MSGSRVVHRVGWLPYVLMGLLVGASLLVAGSVDDTPPSNSDRVFALTRTIQCPVCDGQPVAESESVIAREIRRDIAARVDAGETDDEIRAYYAATQGEDVLLTPSSEGVTGLVWILPVVGLVCALAGLVVVFRRWRARPVAHATAEDRALVARALGTAGVPAGVADDDRPSGGPGASPGAAP